MQFQLHNLVLYYAKCVGDYRLARGAPVGVYITLTVLVPYSKTTRINIGSMSARHRINVDPCIPVIWGVIVVVCQCDFILYCKQITECLVIERLESILNDQLVTNMILNDQLVTNMILNDQLVTNMMLNIVFQNPDH